MMVSTVDNQETPWKQVKLTELHSEVQPSLQQINKLVQLQISIHLAEMMEMKRLSTRLFLLIVPELYKLAVYWRNWHKPNLQRLLMKNQVSL